MDTSERLNRTDRASQVALVVITHLPMQEILEMLV